MSKIDYSNQLYSIASDDDKTLEQLRAHVKLIALNMQISPFSASPEDLDALMELAGIK